MVNVDKGARIVMAVSNDLLTDQRVMRHVAALREAGFAVETVCRTDLPVRWQRGWRFYAAFNWKLRREVSRRVEKAKSDCTPPPPLRGGPPPLCRGGAARGRAM